VPTVFDKHPTWVTVFIGVGANLGSSQAAIQATVQTAFAALAELPHSVWRAASSLYCSAPVDSEGPDYVNAVVMLDTQLAPHALLLELQRIELLAGRLRPYRHAPRTLDLDVLTYGDQHITSPTLTVPHPRAHERAFVLLPWAQIDPHAVLPGHGRVADLLTHVTDQRVTRLIPT
jgi:2-amino-4-hydroxy-6-hydroxymethyldihydropteridine diphosphokinase